MYECILIQLMYLDIKYISVMYLVFKLISVMYFLLQLVFFIQPNHREN